MEFPFFFNKENINRIVVAMVNTWTVPLHFINRHCRVITICSILFPSILQLLLTAMVTKYADLNAAKLVPDIKAEVISAPAPSDSGSTVTNGTLIASQSICASKYSKRHFFTQAESRTPPLLYTFPGSGNTWCRLLIEYGLGIYTGAVFISISQ